MRINEENKNLQVYYESRKILIDELLTHIVDSEWDDRNHRRKERLRKAVGFRYLASFAELDYSPSRNLDKNMILRFSDCTRIREHKDIVITGATGSGKKFFRQCSWISVM